MKRNRALAPVPVAEDQALAERELVLALNQPSSQLRTPHDEGNWFTVDLRVINATYLGADARLALISTMARHNCWSFARPTLEWEHAFGWSKNKSYRVQRELERAGHAHKIGVWSQGMGKIVWRWKFTERPSGVPAKARKLTNLQYQVHGHAALPPDIAAKATAGDFTVWRPSFYTGVKTSNISFLLPKVDLPKKGKVGSALCAKDGILFENQEYPIPLPPAEGGGDFEFAIPEFPSRSDFPVEGENPEARSAYPQSEIPAERVNAETLPVQAEIPDAGKPPHFTRSRDGNRAKGGRAKEKVGPGSRTKGRSKRKPKVHGKQLPGPNRKFKGERAGQGDVSGKTRVKLDGFKASAAVIAPAWEDPDRVMRRAVKDVVGMPVTSSALAVEALQANPTVAMLQEIMGGETWDYETYDRHARRFRRQTYSVPDVMLHYLAWKGEGDNIGRVRCLLDEGRFLRRPSLKALAEDTGVGEAEWEWESLCDENRRLLARPFLQGMPGIFKRVWESAHAASGETPIEIYTGSLHNVSPGGWLFGDPAFLEEKHGLSGRTCLVFLDSLWALCNDGRSRGARQAARLWFDVETHRDWLKNFMFRCPLDAWWLLAAIDRTRLSPASRQWFDRKCGWFLRKLGPDAVGLLVEGVECPVPGWSAMAWMKAVAANHAHYGGTCGEALALVDRALWDQEVSPLLMTLMRQSVHGAWKHRICWARNTRKELMTARVFVEREARWQQNCGIID